MLTNISPHIKCKHTNPPNEIKLSLQIGVQLFLKWAIMQGVAMILQNIYQRQRLYTRIALGKVVLACLGYLISFTTSFFMRSVYIFSEKLTPLLDALIHIDVKISTCKLVCSMSLYRMFSVFFKINILKFVTFFCDLCVMFT